MSSTSKGGRGPSRDFYETPQWCIDQLAAIVRTRLSFPKWVVDLGAGDGRIGFSIQKAFRIEVTGQDTEKDYVIEPELLMVESHPPESLLKSNFKGSVDLLKIGRYQDSNIEVAFGDEGPILFVSNPPYSQAQEFVAKTLELINVYGPGSNGLFLLPLNWLGAAKRVDFHRATKPDRLTILTPRPSFAQFDRVNKNTGKAYKVKTDSNEYAWYWYQYPVGLKGIYRGTMIEIVNRDEKVLL